MLISYIARIRGKLSYQAIENMNLLNKMHEGLIVLSESDLSLKFANLPAVRLMKQMPPKNMAGSQPQNNSTLNEKVVAMME